MSFRGTHSPTPGIVFIPGRPLDHCHYYLSAQPPSHMASTYQRVCGIRKHLRWQLVRAGTDHHDHLGGNSVRFANASPSSRRHRPPALLITFQAKLFVSDQWLRMKFPFIPDKSPHSPRPVSSTSITSSDTKPHIPFSPLPSHPLIPWPFSSCSSAWASMLLSC